MRFKPPVFTVPSDDPFKNDLLFRKQSAEVLTDFVGSLAEPFVLAIDSPWGTGKSTFLRMWLQHLRNQGFDCLYFNAWEYDFTESPLVSLIGEVGAEIKATSLGDRKKIITQLYQKTKNACATLGRAAAPLAVKLATSGLIDVAGFKEEDIAKLAEETAKKQIENYQADKKTIRHFREELGKLVSALAERPGEERKPVVFVVDELDRCRPPYAVELLEKVKHLFSVDGLVFVLAIDRQQLVASVKTMYGLGMKADGYLRRFIDLEYRFPEPDPAGFVRAQFRQLGIDELLRARPGGEQARLEEFLPVLFGLFAFSLRAQEQCFTQVAIALRTTQATYGFYPYLLSVLLCLRAANTSLYFEYCRGQAAPDQVLEYMSALPGGKRFLDSHDGHVTEAYLIFGIRDEKARYAAISACRELANSQDAVGEKKDRARTISAMLQPLTLTHAGSPTEYLFSKLELAHRFVKPEAT